MPNQPKEAEMDTNEKALVPAQRPKGTVAIYDNITDPIKAVEQLGKWIVESQMFGCTSEAQGKMLAWAALSEKKNPLDITREYHIVENRLTKRADAMLAEFQSRGGKRRIKWLKWDKAEASFHITDQYGEEYSLSYTYSDAEQAGYIYGKDRTLKKNWRQSPADMLRARLISKSLRMIEPDIVVGLYTPEEAGDWDEDKSSTPAPAPIFDNVQELPRQPAAVETTKESQVELEAKKPEAEATPEPTIEEMRAAMLDEFKTESTMADRFFAAKQWIGPDKGVPEIADSNVRRWYVNRDQIRKMFAAWKLKQENDSKRNGGK